MITQAEAAQPGVLIFGPIGGIVPGMFPVGAGQLLLADRKARLTWKRWRKIRHVLVVTDSSRPDGKPGTFTGPWAVQAMPRGAEEIYLGAKHWTPEYVYVLPAYERYATVPPMSQGGSVARAARGYVGTPYNFLTYAALAARKLRLVLSDRLLRRMISTRKDQMCSQLADQALADAGFHVFDDGRLPQDVVPAELFRALIERSGTRYLIPGMEAWCDPSVAFWPDAS